MGGAPRSLDLSDGIRAANAAMAARPLRLAEIRPLSGPGAPAAALLRAAAADARTAPGATLVLANPDLHRAATAAASVLLPGAGNGFTRFRPCWPETGASLTPGTALLLQPGEAASWRPRHRSRSGCRRSRRVRTVAALAAAQAARIGIEAIDPTVEAGRFPVKRTVGEIVEVSCDLICDGHDKLGAALLLAAGGAETWQEVRHASARQ